MKPWVPNLKEQVKNGEIANPIIFCYCLFFLHAIYYPFNETDLCKQILLFPIKSNFSVITSIAHVTSALQYVRCMCGKKFDLPEGRSAFVPDSWEVT